MPARDSVNTKMFPNSLAPISALAKSRGLRSVLWFSIEDVFPGTYLATRFPEYMTKGCSLGRANTSNLVDLGNPDALQVQSLSSHPVTIE